MGAGSTPGTGQMPGQTVGFAQTSSVSCISQRQGQSTKGSVSLFCGWKVHQTAASAFSGGSWTLGVYGGVWLRIAAATMAEPECDMRSSEELDQAF